MNKRIELYIPRNIGRTAPLNAGKPMSKSDFHRWITWSEMTIGMSEVTDGFIHASTTITEQGVYEQYAIVTVIVTNNDARAVWETLDTIAERIKAFLYHDAVICTMQDVSVAYL